MDLYSNARSNFKDIDLKFDAAFGKACIVGILNILLFSKWKLCCTLN